MCLGSLGIAVTPGYATIGILAPILLVAARLVQGLSMGGEYATSATYLSEMAPPGRRGFYLGFLQVTVVSGQLVALGLMLLLQHAFLTSAQLEAWGWRIPFCSAAYWRFSHYTYAEALMRRRRSSFIARSSRNTSRSLGCSCTGVRSYLR